VVEQVKEQAAVWFAGRPRLYRVRPSVIEAMRVTGSNFDELDEWTGGVVMFVDYEPGDYIVKDSFGELHTYSPDAFFATFEALIPAVAE
jgi:hypothetical protein